VARRC